MQVCGEQQITLEYGTHASTNYTHALSCIDIYQNRIACDKDLIIGSYNCNIIMNLWAGTVVIIAVLIQYIAVRNILDAVIVQIKDIS